MIKVPRDINPNITSTPRILWVTLLCLLFSVHSPAQSSREYAIKAAFLYNFTQFIEWPATTFATSDAPFVIGVLGEDPFHSSLDEAVAGEKVNDHPIVIQRYQNAKDIKSCHILFISRKESGKLREILASLPAKNILTVSDIPDFASAGGIIRFMTVENKIKLQINLPASKMADLNISSKLLQVADIVR